MNSQSAVTTLDTELAENGLSLSSQPELIKKVKSNLALNKIAAENKTVHDWYRFVLSFPPHLVKEYLEKYKVQKGAVVLDPFCGTGTTLVEASLNGYKAIGIEANAVAHFASQTKLDWSGNPKELLELSGKISRAVNRKLAKSKELKKLSDEQEALLIKNSICPLPLHKILVLQKTIEEESSVALRQYLQLALAKTLVLTASNLRFGPEVGVKGRKGDAPVVEEWCNNVQKIAADLNAVQGRQVYAEIFHNDARNLKNILKKKSVDFVFTSPPYPNEKDYTRATRLESVVLGYIASKEDLRSIKRGLLRSNTRGVYKGDDDDVWVKDNKAINDIADEIERRRIQLKKNSGFEKLYAKVTKLYFGGMARHLAELRPYLKKGAILGYVIGDQASYLQVMIRTGDLLSKIAQELGYEVVTIDLFRTRISTTTKAYMREEVLVLKWNG